MNGESEEEILNVEEQPDGSAIIMEAEVSVEPAEDFYANLVDILPSRFVSSLGSRLSEEIKLDKKAREKRDKQYEEGIRRTGMGDDAPGGASFEGASRAVHPMLAEGCVDFSARAMKELFPPSGPVKTEIIGYLADPEAMDRAERKAEFMNWQLTTQISEYRCSLEQLLTQLPLGGSQFMKFWYDNDAGRIMCEFVPIDNIYLPYEATSYFTAIRMTHSFPVTQMEFERRIKKGMYIETRDLVTPSFTPDESHSQKATDKVEGKSDTGENEDGLRNILECYTFQEMEGDSLAPEGRAVPYIISLDETTEEVLAIYRNWEPNDTRFIRTEWFVEFQFVPWRGAYAIGLPHLIGGLSIAATGALRALLDSAHINNFPGGLKLKGARASGQTVSIAPTELVEIEAPAGVDDIRKVVTPFPFPGPSSVLFQLLEWVTAAAKQMVLTSTEATMNVGDRTPVGTTMALIEQTAIIYSAIHSRLHESQKQCLKIIQRLNRDFLDEQVVVEELGKLIIRKDEFALTNDVVPVSDPAIFSESQRYAQMQSILQMAQDPSVPWNKLKIYQRVLKQMKIQGVEEILPSPPQPVSADPITEITAAMSGQNLMAQPGMPHMQHLQEEISFLLDPVFGAANPAIMNPGFSVIMTDIMQHLTLLFAELKQKTQQQAQMQAVQMLSVQARVQGVPPEMSQMFVSQMIQRPEIQQQIQRQAAMFWQQSQQQLQPMMQALAQADQLVKSKIPPPQDPALAAQLQAVQMQEQTKMQLGQMKQQMEHEKLEQDKVFKEMEIKLEGFVRTQLELQKQQMSVETELAKNRDDNEQKMATEIAKNNDDNMSNLEIARLRSQADAEKAIVVKQMDIEADMASVESDMLKSSVDSEQSLAQEVVKQTMESALERERMTNDKEIAERQMKSQEKIAKMAAERAKPSSTSPKGSKEK